MNSRQNIIAIVVVTYNRPGSLIRLLNSIANANYETSSNIPLVISIDYSGSNDCKDIAEMFDWQHGSKTVVHHPHHLGLKKHILSCGYLTDVYDAVIVLEDDLTVSPYYYDFAQSAYEFYKNDDTVAGIALYKNVFNEVAYCPFDPIDDGFDTYFMQVPCSWGQLWTSRQWENFVKYINNNNNTEIVKLPDAVEKWSDAKSWKKDFYKYLLGTNRYFVYPRISLSTNFGIPGFNVVASQNSFQASLLLGKRIFKFSTFTETKSIYDAYYEPSGVMYNRWYNSDLDIDFDLSGCKPLKYIRTKFLISSKICTRPQKKYATQYYPYENNVLFSLEATEGEDCFYFGKTENFIEKNRFQKLKREFMRLFMTDAYLKNEYRIEFEKSREFMLGRVLLKPIHLVKRILQIK